MKMKREKAVQRRVTVVYRPWPKQEEEKKTITLPPPTKTRNRTTTRHDTERDLFAKEACMHSACSKEGRKESRKE